MGKKKIFWLHTHTLYSTGATRFIYEVASRLNKRYEVHLIVEKTSDFWWSKFSRSNIQVREISSYSSNTLTYWLFFPFFFLRNLLVLQRLIRKNDVVISSMFPSNVWASLLSQRHIYYCFEPFAFFYDRPLMGQEGLLKYGLLRILSLFYSWLDKLGTNHAEKILAINPSVGAHIKAIYNRQPDAYSYLGVDTAHFSPKKIDTSPLFTFFHSTDYTLLKGTQYLLAALPYLSPYASQFRILISESVSNAKLKKQLVNKIIELDMTQSVLFLGHLEYEALPYYYSLSDCFLFLGDPRSGGATAASLSVLEAQSCGLPVLRSLGNSDEIVSGKTGYFINPLDPQEFAEKMIFAIKNRSNFAGMGVAAREHIASSYTWDKVDAVFNQSLQQIV